MTSTSRRREPPNIPFTTAAYLPDPRRVVGGPVDEPLVNVLGGDSLIAGRDLPDVNVE